MRGLLTGLVYLYKDKAHDTRNHYSGNHNPDGFYVHTSAPINSPLILSLGKQEKENTESNYTQSKNPNRVHDYSSLGNINHPTTKDTVAMNRTPAIVKALTSSDMNLPITPTVKANFPMSKKTSPSFFLLSIPSDYIRRFCHASFDSL